MVYGGKPYEKMTENLSQICADRESQYQVKIRKSALYFDHAHSSVRKSKWLCLLKQICFLSISAETPLINCDTVFRNIWSKTYVYHKQMINYPPMYWKVLSLDVVFETEIPNGTLLVTLPNQLHFFYTILLLLSRGTQSGYICLGEDDHH